MNGTQCSHEPFSPRPWWHAAAVGALALGAAGSQTPAPTLPPPPLQTPHSLLLRDARQLRAEIRELGVHRGAHVLLELSRQLQGARVHHHRRQLDDLLQQQGSKGGRGREQVGRGLCRVQVAGTTVCSSAGRAANAGKNDLYVQQSREEQDGAAESGRQRTCGESFFSWSQVASMSTTSR